MARLLLTIAVASCGPKRPVTLPIQPPGDLSVERALFRFRVAGPADAVALDRLAVETEGVGRSVLHNLASKPCVTLDPCVAVDDGYWREEDVVDAWRRVNNPAADGFADAYPLRTSAEKPPVEPSGPAPRGESLDSWRSARRSDGRVDYSAPLPRPTAPKDWGALLRSVVADDASTELIANIARTEQGREALLEHLELLDERARDAFLHSLPTFFDDERLLDVARALPTRHRAWAKLQPLRIERGDLDGLLPLFERGEWQTAALAALTAQHHPEPLVTLLRERLQRADDVRSHRLLLRVMGPNPAYQDLVVARLEDPRAPIGIEERVHWNALLDVRPTPEEWLAILDASDDWIAGADFMPPPGIVRRLFTLDLRDREVERPQRVAAMLVRHAFVEGDPRWLTAAIATGDPTWGHATLDWLERLGSRDLEGPVASLVAQLAAHADPDVAARAAQRP